MWSIYPLYLSTMGCVFPPNAGMTHALMCLQLHNYFWVSVKHQTFLLTSSLCCCLWAFDSVVLHVWVSESQTLWPCGLEGPFSWLAQGLLAPFNYINVQRPNSVPLEAVGKLPPAQMDLRIRAKSFFERRYGDTCTLFSSWRLVFCDSFPFSSTL